MSDSRFDRDTAVVPLGDGRYRGRMDRGWWIERGPNGGYVAAVILRALTLEVADPARTPRSFTVHYLAPPAEGDVTVVVTTERAGRSLTYLSARLLQGDRLLATSLAAFAVTMPGIEFADLRPPVVASPAELPVMPTALPGGPPIPMRERYEFRWGVGGGPFSGADEAIAGGWIRLREPRPYDHLLVAALADAWMPPVFTKSAERVAVPTVDLTVHFRAPLPLASMSAEDYALCVFRSQVAAEGFIEEDGEIWSHDGVLLAHSRQLAVLLPA